MYGVAERRPFVPGGYQVRRSWFHLPEDVSVGDRFRVAYVTHHGIDATSGDVADYDALVQYEAAQEYNDRFIRSIASEFKAVVCTETVDARTHTDMTDNLGVPVHWLGGGFDDLDDHGTLIAGSYDAFYGGGWVNREYGAIVTGNSTYFYGITKVMWTGCDAQGAAHPYAYMGTTIAHGRRGHGRRIGTSWETMRTPPSSLRLAPSTSTDWVRQRRNRSDSAESTQFSPVFTVVP